MGYSSTVKKDSKIQRESELDFFINLTNLHSCLDAWQQGTKNNKIISLIYG